MHTYVEICRRCGGTAADVTNTDHKPCPECGGKGYIELGNCKKCKRKKA